MVSFVSCAPRDGASGVLNNNRSFRTLSLFAGVAAASLLSVSSAIAGSTNYGDFSGTNFMWLDVTENATSAGDTEPLFGAPESVADTLFFDDMDFTSSASNGSTDSTVGMLTTTVMAMGNAYITDLVFNEFGDYSLTGLSGEATATVAAAFTITIQEANQAPIADVVIAVNMSFNPDSGMFELTNNGQQNASPWNGGLSVDIAQALLDAGVAGNATKVLIELTNTLETTSEAGNSAFIAKKTFGGTSITVIPTPGALVMLGLAGAVASRRRRRG